MRNGIVKVPSYLVDMVMLESKTLILKSENSVLSKLNKKVIEGKIKQIESKEFTGMLYEKAIKYHLIQIDTNETKADCKEKYAEI